MFSKEEFLATVEEETQICLHLASRLGEGDFDFRPAASVRSTLELMRYMTYTGVGPLDCMLAGDWSRIQQRIAGAEGMGGAEFSERMEAQLAEMKALLADLDEAEIARRRVQLPWGVELPLGNALVTVCLRFLTAYRMQLFLHAKLCGHDELSTMNCWRGEDPPAEST